MNDTGRTVEFVSFCLEMYSRDKEISGTDAMRHFEQYGVTGYLFANYEVLHTQGWRYIISLIDEFINNRKGEK